MPTAYGISNCIGWYRAGVGVYSDAGSTPANNGDSVAQWNDQSGAGNHLTQTSSAVRPVYSTYATAGTTTAAGSTAFSPFGQVTNTYGIAEPPALFFDGGTTYLNIPSSAAFTSTVGATAILCTRGYGMFPLGIGTLPAFSFGYGYPGPIGGAGVQVGFIIKSAANQLFAKRTFLPSNQPMVHGFAIDSANRATRLYMGTNQSDSLAVNIFGANLSGGMVGRMSQSVSPFNYGYFKGEILELAIFNQPLSDATTRTLISQMQDANAIRADANTNLLVLVGDTQTAGGPAYQSLHHSYGFWLSRSYGGTLKPMQLGYPAATCAQQQSLVNNLATLDLSPFGQIVAVCCCGLQDILNGSTDVQAQAAFIALAQSLKAVSNLKLIAVVPTHQDSGTGLTTQQLTYFHNYQAWLRSNALQYADALVDWTADPRLSNATTDASCWTDEFNTTEIGDRVKAALVKPAIDSLTGLGATPIPATLSFGSFYAPGRSYAGSYGTFLRA